MKISNLEKRVKLENFLKRLLNISNKLQFYFPLLATKFLLGNIFIPDGNVFLEKNSETLRSRIE